MQTQEPEELTPEVLIWRFSRCGNYPKDELGIRYLIMGLARASEQSGITAVDIVERCATISQFCPTDADLMTVARDIRTERLDAAEKQQQSRERANWERTYGPPKKFKQGDTCLCCGRKWSEIIATAGEKDREMREKISAILGTRDWRLIPWGRIKAAKVKAGYELVDAAEKRLAEGWL